MAGRQRKVQQLMLRQPIGRSNKDGSFTLTPDEWQAVRAMDDDTLSGVELYGVGNAVEGVVIGDQHYEVEVILHP